jgi:ankyrin repeat protein
MQIFRYPWPHWNVDLAPLHLAAGHGHPTLVRLLLKAGADPESAPEKTKSRSSASRTSSGDWSLSIVEDTATEV